MRQASSHRMSGMIIEIIDRPSSRIYLFSEFVFDVANLYILFHMSKTSASFF